jgi:hypothetical protein
VELIKGRTLELGEKVFVYRNLHKQTFSVKNMETGLVVAHSDNVMLVDCKFKVSERGRQRVLREKRKNVHAGVVGYYMGEHLIGATQSHATYNPYLYPSFIDRSSQEPLREAYYVFLSNDGVTYRTNKEVF